MSVRKSSRCAKPPLRYHDEGMESEDSLPDLGYTGLPVSVGSPNWSPGPRLVKESSERGRSKAKSSRGKQRSRRGRGGGGFKAEMRNFEQNLSRGRLVFGLNSDSSPSPERGEGSQVRLRGEGNSPSQRSGNGSEVVPAEETEPALTDELTVSPLQGQRSPSDDRDMFSPSPRDTDVTMTPPRERSPADRRSPETVNVTSNPAKLRQTKTDIVEDSGGKTNQAVVAEVSLDIMKEKQKLSEKLNKNEVARRLRVRYPLCYPGKDIAFIAARVGTTLKSLMKQYTLYLKETNRSGSSGPPQSDLGNVCSEIAAIDRSLSMPGARIEVQQQENSTNHLLMSDAERDQSNQILRLDPKSSEELARQNRKASATVGKEAREKSLAKHRINRGGNPRVESSMVTASQEITRISGRGNEMSTFMAYSLQEDKKREDEREERRLERREEKKEEIRLEREKLDMEKKENEKKEEAARREREKKRRKGCRGPRSSNSNHDATTINDGKSHQKYGWRRSHYGWACTR